MPLVRYTPKAGAFVLPLVVRFLSDEYTITLKEGVNNLTEEEANYLKKDPDATTIYEVAIQYLNSDAKPPVSNPPASENNVEIVGDPSVKTEETKSRSRAKSTSDEA